LSNISISCLFLAYQIKKLLAKNTPDAGGVWQALKKSAEVENDLGVYRLIQRKLIIDTEIAGKVCLMQRQALFIMEGVSTNKVCLTC